MRYLFFVACLFPVWIVASCNTAGNDESPVAEASISAPLNGSEYDFNTRIHFQADSCEGKIITWRSTEGKTIFEGANADLILPSGSHGIDLLVNNSLVDHVSFVVNPPKLNVGDFLHYVQTTKNMSLALPLGRYNVGLINAGASKITANLGLEEQKDCDKSLRKTWTDDDLPFLPRDYQLHLPNGYSVTSFGTVEEKAVNKRGIDSALAVGSVRSFFLPNLADGGQTVSTIQGVAVRVSNTAVFWVDADSAVSEPELDLLWVAAARIIPNCASIWGSWGATGKDERIHILLSKRINEAAVAVGFFNPADVLPRDIDPNNKSYNPYSNELNLLNLGTPQAGVAREAFSIQSLSATIAHELTHLIHFERKSRQAILSGAASPPLEETFLDEGLAHLSECLNGYGISGGNILFAERYLSHSFEYSFSGLSTSGQGDTVGRRGAMVLLLSWLFWKEGGLSISPDNAIMDGGGISFVKAIIEGGKTGWDAILYASGLGRQKILAEFLDYTMSGSMETVFPVDAVTGEPLGLTPYSGPFLYTDGSVVQLSGFEPLDPTEDVTLASFSIANCGNFDVAAWPVLTLSGPDSAINNVLGAFTSVWLMTE